jgi:hypothetical protein
MVAYGNEVCLCLCFLVAGSVRKENLDPANRVHGEEHSEVHGGALEPPQCTVECQWGASAVSG